MAVPFPENVRLAVRGDEERVLDVLKSLERDNGFGIPSDDQRILDQIRVGTERRGGMIGIIEEDGIVVASVGLFLSSWWYAAPDQVYLGELWLYVRPEYRDMHYERDLFQFCRASRDALSLAAEHEIALVSSVSSPSRLEAKTRLWRRLLGPKAKQVGAIFTVDA